MSAIWGFINLNGNKASERLGLNMMESLKKYKIDDYKYILKDNVFFGCGMEYITPESLNEKLPYFDYDNSLMITADAIIDNREELASKLNISLDRLSSLSDSTLILEAYKFWGKECTKHLIGDFSFVIWDKLKEEVFCVRDHTAKRTFYYYKTKDVFAFSTLIKPLLVLKESSELNEKWLVDFLTTPGLLHVANCTDSVYKDIHQIPPANYLVLKDNKMNFTQYWDPIKNLKKLRFNSHEECANEFRKILLEAVKCRIRGNGDIGISLSGGLDSGAVAVLSASILKEENRTLKSFTSIPMDNFNGDIPNSRVADEREYINEILNKYDNIKPSFIDYKGKDALSNVDEIMELIEQPYKTIHNTPWLIEVYNKAYESGCRVILSGQHGNNSFSQGDFLTYMRTLFQQFRYIEMYKEMKCFSELHKAPLKNVFRGVRKVLAPRFIVDIKRGNFKKCKFKNYIANDELVEKYNSLKRFESIDYMNNVNYNLNVKESKVATMSPLAFSHISEISTKLSLATGVCVRDPSRDIRIIEFCLRLPYNEFVDKGMERFLIRNSMKGLLPDKIRLNINKRGLQAADWIERLQLRWDDINENVKSEIFRDSNSKYLSLEKLEKIYSKHSEALSPDDDDGVMKICFAYIFSRFINKNIERR